MKICVTYMEKIKKYCLIIVLIAFLITIGTIQNMNVTSKVNATPTTNKRIIIDAGHGLPDQGTASSSGITEQNINLQIALKLQGLLETSGADVLLTRSDENGIYDVDKNSIRDKKISDTKNRVEIGNNSDADIFVSIHLNYYQDGKYRGWQTFYQSTSAESKKLASDIQAEMNSNFNRENIRQPMAIKGVYIVDKIKIPTVIVECGFLSNVDEEKLLQETSYQDSIAWGIYLGIQKYFSNNI